MSSSNLPPSDKKSSPSVPDQPVPSCAGGSLCQGSTAQEGKGGWRGTLSRILGELGGHEAESYGNYCKKLVTRENFKEGMKEAGAPSYVVDCGHWAINQDGVGVIGVGAEDLRYNPAHLAHCGNVWLCPECRSYILRGRTEEVIRAADKAKLDGLHLFMFTVTVANTWDLVSTVSAFRRAWSALKSSRAWREFWGKYPGPVGRSFIANWEMTFGPANTINQGGIHLHRHLLLFLPAVPDSVDSERLKFAWIQAATNAGLKADISGQDFEPFNEAKYISKIGFELTDSGLSKEGRRNDRYNLKGLLEHDLVGDEWARIQLRQYVLATHGLRALAWSQGLKAWAGVAEKTDAEVECDSRVRYGYVPYLWYNSQKRGVREGFLFDLAVFICFKNEANLKSACRRAKVNFYGHDGRLLFQGGRPDSQDTQADIRFLAENESELEQMKIEEKKS